MDQFRHFGLPHLRAVAIFFIIECIERVCVHAFAGFWRELKKGGRTGHSKKLFRWRTRIRKFVFHNRIIDKQNSLSNSDVNCNWLTDWCVCDRFLMSFWTRSFVRHTRTLIARLRECSRRRMSWRSVFSGRQRLQISHSHSTMSLRNSHSLNERLLHYIVVLVWFMMVMMVVWLWLYGILHPCSSRLEQTLWHLQYASLLRTKQTATVILFYSD